MKLWIDVEDLFAYAVHVKRPSGIQRVAYELQRALMEIAPDSVRFLRHGKHSDGFVAVPFAHIDALFSELSATLPANAEAPAPADGAARSGGTQEPPLGLIRRVRRRALAMLPQPLRDLVIRLLLRAAETAAAAGVVAKTIVNVNTWRAQTPIQEPSSYQTLTRETCLATADGDWLLVLGSPWSSPDYAARVSHFCALHGLRFALLTYDIIPVRRPEWVDHSLRRAFDDWFHSVVPLADAVLAISHATAQDVERYAKEAAFALPGRVHPIPLGTGGGCPPAPVRTRRLPARRSFALIVSTIEIRKNHLLLFRIWRELTEQMPLEQIRPWCLPAASAGWCRI